MGRLSSGERYYADHIARLSQTAQAIHTGGNAAGMIEHNPYDNLKIERGRHQEREYLLDDERERIEQLDLSDVPEADKARDMFIFDCYTGLSYSDIVGIRKGDIKAVDGRKMLYTQRKETATPLHITILPKALAIL